MIDTGIRPTHFIFGGRASIGTDTVGDGRDGHDCHGHGTHVAGTAAGGPFGVAKEVKVVGVRVLGCTGNGSWSTVIAGIDWVTRNAKKPAVVNMSLGAPSTEPGTSDVENAIRNSIRSGITYTVSAGNDNDDACGYTPGRISEVITVGNSNQNDVRQPDSNFGSCLDIWAPGADIVSGWYDGDWSFNMISGTSMSSPHLAGPAALYLSANPGATPAQVRSWLVNRATNDKIQDAKPGSPNKLLYTGA